MKLINVLVAGVGGQGNILASDIIGEVAIAAGYDVKKTDTLGMAQRGGAVVSHVRIAPEVYSPLIREGEVDILLAFEKLEAARWSHYLRRGGAAIVNNHALPPLSVSIGNERYPNDKEINDILKRSTDRAYFVEGTYCARMLGNPRVLNMFMLGCLSLLLPFKVYAWQDTIAQHLAPNLRQINSIAFDAGRKQMRHVYL
jgi:indolepyruvate ferredoxin oxidoreductase beta subunit